MKVAPIAAPPVVSPLGKSCPIVSQFVRVPPDRLSLAIPQRMERPGSGTQDERGYGPRPARTEAVRRAEWKSSRAGGRGGRQAGWAAAPHRRGASHVPAGKMAVWSPELQASWAAP